MSTTTGFNAHGFVLNKLYMLKCFAGRKKHHGKHTAVRNLFKGAPPEEHSNISSAINDLRARGLILTFPSTGETHACALRTDEALEIGLLICNDYRLSVGLRPLDKRFREVMKEKEAKPTTTTPSHKKQKEKRALEWKKYAEEQAEYWIKKARELSQESE